MHSPLASNAGYQISLHKVWVTLTDRVGEKDGGDREGWSASHVSKPQPVVTAKTRARVTTGIHPKGTQDSLWMRAGQEDLGL